MAIVAFEVANGTIIPIDNEAHDAARVCTTLIFVLCATVVLNFLVIVTILRSFLRSHAFNMIVATICAACLLDGLVNVPLAAVFRASWTDLYRWTGRTLIWCCRFSCAFSQFCLALQVSGVLLLSTHRLAELPQHADSFGPIKPHGSKRYNWLLLFSWLGSLTTVFPSIFGLVDVYYFQERYSCGYVNVSNHAASLATAVSQLTFGHVVPYIALFGVWFVIIWRILRERQRLLAFELVAMRRAAALSSPVRGIGSSHPTWEQFWSDGEEASGEGYRFLILCGLLAISLILLILPGWIYSTVSQFVLPTQLPTNHPAYWHNMLPEDLQPLRSSWVDNTFTWMRFIYNIVVPILVLAFHPPLRAQLCALFKLCKRKRFSAVASVSAYLTVRPRKRQRKKSKFQHLFDELTPVLFVTSDGLYVRQSFETKLGYFVPVFVDLCVKSPREGVKKVIMAKKSLKEDVTVFEEDDVHRRKPGKTVRFSQGVKEIPESVFGSSPDESLEEVVMTSSNAWNERRNSAPIVARGTKDKSLEMELLANSSFASSSSSSSLIMPFAKRLRKRDY